MHDTHRTPFPCDANSLLYSALSNAKKGEKTINLHIENYGDVRFSAEVCCSSLHKLLENSVSGG